MNQPFLVHAFPTAAGQPLYWWLVSDDAVQAWGCDANPVEAAGLDEDQGSDEPVRAIALLPSHLATVQWHERPDDITDLQAQAAAKLAAREASLGGDDVHIVAAMDDGRPVTALIDKSEFARGLEILVALGLDTDAVLPSGWIVPPANEGFSSADLGFDKLLRGDSLIAPDDPALHQLLLGEQPVSPVTGDSFDAMLVGAPERCELDFRSGAFEKRVRRAMAPAQRRKLLALAALLLLVTAVIPLVQLGKYYWAANSANEASMERAAQVLETVESPVQAEQALDARLRAENKGNIQFPVPAAALYSSLQQTPNVSIERLSYGSNGIVSATLTAIQNEDMNPALIAIQDAGFVITATPRTDATGVAKADITVRAP